MQKLLLSSVLMLCLCVVSFAQSAKQALKIKARTEALKKSDAQNAVHASPVSPATIQKIMFEKLAAEEARNRETRAANASSVFIPLPPVSLQSKKIIRDN